MDYSYVNEVNCTWHYRPCKCQNMLPVTKVNVEGKVKWFAFFRVQTVLAKGVVTTPLNDGPMKTLSHYFFLIFATRYNSRHLSKYLERFP